MLQLFSVEGNALNMSVRVKEMHFGKNTKHKVRRVILICSECCAMKGLLSADSSLMALTKALECTLSFYLVFACIVHADNLYDNNKAECLCGRKEIDLKAYGVLLKTVSSSVTLISLIVKTYSCEI